MTKNKEFVREIVIDPVSLAIARLAQHYMEEDGSPADSETRYWLRAEAEVLASQGMPLPDEPERAPYSRSER
jgi:hypothetical protein